MFERIEWDKLVVGEVYLILYIIKGRYKGIVEHAPYPSLEFDYLNPELNIKNDNCYFTDEHSYYKLVSQKNKIQSDMENRAVNLIIRRLIGDDNFEW